MTRLLRIAMLLLMLGWWLWPVAEPHPVVRPFVAPETPYSSGHRGIDVQVPRTMPVRSPVDGIVRFAGFVVDRSVVSIAHGEGVISSYEPVDPVVAEGQRVRRGDVIGTVAEGHCAETCLHIGVRVDGGYVNPLLFLGGIAPSVLLPMP
jgi:murein DD-endopeptidase MepM/ murein hydrolase activator NlpD